MTYLLVTCKVLGQSPLQPDQYRSSIKSLVLLYLSDYSQITTTIQFKLTKIRFLQSPNQATYNDLDVNQQFNWKLHFVNQYCFCNTELRTATVTKIKGLSIQTQQNTFVLFTLFKLTLDEHKTLTKISMRKPLTTVPQTSTHLRRQLKGKQQVIQKRAVCIVRGKTSFSCLALFKLGSIIMHIILMILIIVMASVIASSTSVWSMKITTMATATSTLIIAIVIIVITTTRKIKLPMVTLKLASIIILLSPFPLLGPFMWPPTVTLAPIGSMASIIISIILIVVVVISIFILSFLFKGRGRWLRLLLWFCFAFPFLSSTASSTLKWFRYTCGVLVLRLCYVRI